MSQKIIIFDSVDSCGKTEMSLELSRRLKIPYFKNNREKMFFEDDPGYFVKALRYGDPYFASYLKQSGASIILDRSYPSEFCYSQAFERTTDWGMLRIVDEMHAELGTKIICPYRTDYSNAKDDFAALTQAKLEKLHKLYEDFCSWTKCDVLRLCVDNEDLDEEMGLIVPFVEK